MYLCFTFSGVRWFAPMNAVILGGTDIYIVGRAAPVLPDFPAVTNIRIVGSAKEALNWVKDGTPSGVE